jgi:hypothetical protein
MVYSTRKIVRAIRPGKFAMQRKEQRKEPCNIKITRTVTAEGVDVVSKALVREAQTMEDEEPGSVGPETLDLMPSRVICPSDRNQTAEPHPHLQDLLLARLHQQWQPRFSLVEQVTGVLALAARLSVALPLPRRLLLDGVVDEELFPPRFHLFDLSPEQKRCRSRSIRLHSRLTQSFRSR